MGSMEDRGAKLDRLYRILAAMANQRAAHEHNGSELIYQPQFAKRIEYINVGVACRKCAARAQRRLQVGGCGNFRNGRASLRMPGRDDREEVWTLDFEPTMNLDEGALFAGMGRSRCHRDSSCGRLGEGGELAGVDRQGGDVQFEIAGYADAGRPERAEACRIAGRTYQAK